MPATAVDLLKSTDYWEIPYRYDHPTGIQLMDGALPEGYNMLHKSYADVKSSLSDFDFDPEENDESEKRDQLEDHEEKEQQEEKEVIGQKEDDNEMLEEEEEEEEEEEGEKQQKWKISKVVGGKTTYINVKQALKLLLPREYIARCRQKRHWAAKYLPGKSPLDPMHDVVRYSHVALKSVLKGRKVFNIESSQFEGEPRHNFA